MRRRDLLGEVELTDGPLHLAGGLYGAATAAPSLRHEHTMFLFLPRHKQVLVNIVVASPLHAVETGGVRDCPSGRAVEELCSF